MTHKIIFILPEELSPENDPTGVLAALENQRHPLSELLAEDSELPYKLEVAYGSDTLHACANLPMQLEMFSAAGCLLNYYRFEEDWHREGGVESVLITLAEHGSIFIPFCDILCLTHAQQDSLISCPKQMLELGVFLIDDDDEFPDDDDDDDEFPDDDLDDDESPDLDDNAAKANL